MEPLAGMFEDYCTNGPMDLGSHTVCAEVSAVSVEFPSGNDVVTPRPEFDFRGLKPDDRCCLCVARWTEVYDDGVVPSVVLPATNAAARWVVELDTPIQHSADTS